MGVIDLKSVGRFGHPGVLATLRSAPHEHRTDPLRATAGLLAAARVSTLRPALPRQSTRPHPLVSGSTAGDDVRAVDLPRQPARHRHLPSLAGTEALPLRLPRPALP